MSRENFLRGAMILTMAGLMVKIIGSVNRILLSRMLGGEGIGLYQMAYPVYLLLLAVSSAGIPIAISIIVAEKIARRDFYNAHRIFRVSLCLMSATGLFFAALLFFGASWLVETGYVRDPRAYYGLVALTPAVFFSTILASFRGYFQGYQLMTPPAVSQILEQFVRVATMVALAYWLLPYGLEYAAAGAAFGAVPGGAAGLCVLSFFYFKYRSLWRANAAAVSCPRESVGMIAKRLALLSLPVSCANIMVPVTSSIDMLLVPNRLVAHGFSVEAATTLFGYLAGMAQPLLMMATIPTMSLAASLVPAISEAYTLGRREEILQKSRTAMKLCCLLVMPAFIGLAALAEPISLFLYGTAQASAAIMHSAPAILCLGVYQVTTGMLQGVGRTRIPMLNMLAGILIKIVCVWFATDAVWNVAGAAWGTNINFALAAALNILALRRCGVTFDGGAFLKINLAAALMGTAAYGLRTFLAGLCVPPVATIIALLSAALFYAALLPLLGAVTKKELGGLHVIKKFYGERKKG